MELWMCYIIICDIIEYEKCSLKLSDNEGNNFIKSNVISSSREWIKVWNRLITIVCYSEVWDVLEVKRLQCKPYIYTIFTVP